MGRLCALVEGRNKSRPRHAPGQFQPRQPFSPFGDGSDQSCRDLRVRNPDVGKSDRNEESPALLVAPQACLILAKSIHSETKGLKSLKPIHTLNSTVYCY